LEAVLMPASSARAAIWQLHMMRYHDGLLGDLGERQRRKGWNVLAEVLAPYSAGDYSDLFRLATMGAAGEAHPTAAEVVTEFSKSAFATTRWPRVARAAQPLAQQVR